MAASLAPTRLRTLPRRRYTRDNLLGGLGRWRAVAHFIAVLTTVNATV